MATIKYLINGKGESRSIYLRLSINRENIFKRKSGFVIHSNNWSIKTGYPKQGDEELKKLKSDLTELQLKIIKRLNDATANSETVDGLWLQRQIDLHNGVDKERTDNLIEYFDYYIYKLPNKVQSGDKVGVAPSTIQKYTNVKNKVEAFQRYAKRTYRVKDVNLKFRDEFLAFLRDIDHLNTNTIGRLIRFLKTVCLDAKKNGIETHIQLEQIKGFTEKHDKIILSFIELDKIERVKLQREALINARDWLIIGCYTGQRVSDLLKLTKQNFIVINSRKFIELTQQKTGKRVLIPLHEKVQKILDKREGNFPEKISDQKFNLHIKDVAKEAKIEEPTQGGLINKNTNRKEFGVYPKHQLITSHICRRSFATNFYGSIPTPVLMAVTAHSTEKQFLEYIGKTSVDYAEQLAEYWSIKSDAKGGHSLTVVHKRAN